MADNKLYDILGVPRTASDQEIKKVKFPITLFYFPKSTPLFPLKNLRSRSQEHFHFFPKKLLGVHKLTFLPCSTLSTMP